MQAGTVDELELRPGSRTDFRRQRPIRRLAVLGAAAPALLWAVIEAGAAQGLPPGGGPVPAVRRGADGQIELVRPNPARPAGSNRHGTAPAAAAPKAGSPPIRREAPAAAAPRNPPAVPATPVITVTPNSPVVPDTTPRGAVVAIYSVRMSDGSPFTGTVRFGPPYYDGKGVFALSGNNIIVNPNGPGLGRRKITSTDHVTLEAAP